MSKVAHTRPIFPELFQARPVGNQCGRTFTDRMPFLSHKQQHRSTEKSRCSWQHAATMMGQKHYNRCTGCQENILPVRMCVLTRRQLAAITLSQWARNTDDTAETGKAKRQVLNSCIKHTSLVISSTPVFLRHILPNSAAQFAKFCKILWRYYPQIPYILQPVCVVLLTDNTSKCKEFIVTCNMKTHYVRPLMTKISS